LGREEKEMAQGEERETLERGRERGVEIGKPLDCSFLIPDDYNAYVFIVSSRLVSYVI